MGELIIRSLELKGFLKKITSGLATGGEHLFEQRWEVKDS